MVIPIEAAVTLGGVGSYVFHYQITNQTWTALVSQRCGPALTTTTVYFSSGASVCFFYRVVVWELENLHCGRSMVIPTGTVAI